jgi:Rrf2 family iron-sulfur cluster assembly transcriptional regulator
MLDLALHSDAGPVAMADIAARNRISPAYLEQLLATLRRKGLVESLRGPGGGYRLKALPERITVAAIMAAMDEDVDATRCGGERNCQDGGRCLTHDLWEDLTQHIEEFLEAVSLGELRDRHRRRERGEYPIHMPASEAVFLRAQESLPTK